MSLRSSMPAMRLVSGHAWLFARGSITAALVIRTTRFLRVCYHFRLWPTLAKKCQQRVMTMQPLRGGNGRIEGLGVVIREPIVRRPWAAARLFQRLRAPDGAARRRRRRDPEVR